MKITVKKSKQIVSRQELDSGDVFYYDGCFYMAIDVIELCDQDYTYDSINLLNGKPIYIGDEEVYQIDYEFIVK